MKKMTTSVLLWDVQADLLHYAATRENMNVSEFFRDIIVPMVAERCKKPVPRVPRIERRTPSSYPAPSQSGQHAVDLDALAEAVVHKMAALAANGSKK